MDMHVDPAAALVDASGQPVAKRRLEDTRCPVCRAPKAKRMKSCGFGQPSTLCGVCGYDFHQPWQEGA